MNGRVQQSTRLNVNVTVFLNKNFPYCKARLNLAVSSNLAVFKFTEFETN